MKQRKPRVDKGSGQGTASWVQLGNGRGYYAARLQMPDGRRVRQKLTWKGRLLTDRDADLELAKRLTGQLSGLTRELSPEPPQPATPKTTVEQFGTMWTSGKLFELHGEVRGLGPKDSAAQDESRLRVHVYPYIGQKAVADVEEVDAEACMASAARAAHARRGKPLRQATKQQIYQALHRLFDLAVKPGRLRADNPVSKDLKPRRDKPLLYAFLYPEELLKLCACTEIPLGRRVRYVVAVYCGLRKSSLKALMWPWIDFANGTMAALVTKTRVPQMFEVREDVLAILQSWYEHCGSPKGKALVFPRDTLGGKRNREAETLRADLRRAGVTRELLFSDEANVQPLRFHDTRATFVTWALRAGKGYGWITNRTGHVSEAMMLLYARGVETLNDLRYEPFPDLAKAIPEFQVGDGKVLRLRRS